MLTPLIQLNICISMKQIIVHVSPLSSNTHCQTFKLDELPFYRLPLLLSLVACCHILHHFSLYIWARHLISLLWFHTPFSLFTWLWNPWCLKLFIFGTACPAGFMDNCSVLTFLKLHALYTLFLFCLFWAFISPTHLLVCCLDHAV